MTTPPTPETPDSSSGCLHPILFTLASVWIVAVTALVHTLAWMTDQVLMISGTPWPWYAWPLVSWGHGLLLLIPVLPLALFVRAPRFQAAYRAWLLAIAYLFVLGPVRIFPATWSQPAAVLQIALSLACSVGLIALARMRGRRLAFSLNDLLLGLALAPLAALPSLDFGALGSALDTLLGLLAGLSLGLFAGLLISTLLMAPLAEHTAGRGRDVLLGGFAAGIALLILGAGFGFGGDQLLLGISLPALGFAAAGLGQFAGADGAADRGWLPVAAFVGLAAAAPLTLVDPEELTLLLGGDEILQWALIAAFASVVFGWGLGAALIVAGRLNLKPRLNPAGVRLAGLALAWLIGLGTYFFGGQPGFYGERLFVIWRDQADLTPAGAIADRNERLAYVYRTLTEHADATQADVRATLDRLGIEYTPYYLVNAIEVQAGPLLRVYLASRPEVDRILDSPRLRPLPAPVPVSEGTEGPPTRPQWNITSIGADRVWQEFGVTGAGIVVGQSDSGVQGDHPALREGYRGRDGGDDYNWLDPWNGTAAPTDIGGHGTHTLGSILGRGDTPAPNAGAGVGVAPGAEWFACVNLARNLANPALYLDCMQFMLAPYPQGGDPLHDGDPARAAHVLNNSWGCPPLEGCDAGALAPAVSALRAAGIFVVTSAGNEGPNCGSVSDPIAIYDDAFSVGAIAEGGNVAGFSSRGPVEVDGSGRIKPDILAPGVDVWSAMPGSAYGLNSGTSMAGPHVVGVVALLWSAQPALIGDIDRTEQILIETADPYTGVDAGACSPPGVPDNTAGYGTVNAYAAVKAALAGP